MKFAVLVLCLLISKITFAGKQIDWLVENNINEYFPSDADYIKLDSVCNKITCFKLVVISYVTSTNKGMRRVAVFSGSDVYLGVYSGFQESPVKVSGSQLLFPKSEFGYKINFNENIPPISAYIDGEHFVFESKP